MCLDGVDRIECGVMMTGELHVAVQCNAVNQLEQFAASQCNHLFGSREPTVVTHDSTCIATSQQHICFLYQTNLSASFSCCYRSGCTSPSASYDNYSHITYYFIFTCSLQWWMTRLSAVISVHAPHTPSPQHILALLQAESFTWRLPI